MREIKGMKAVILAGGAKSTINTEQEGIPKPMLEVGGKPLLWHIMKFFSGFGIRDFIVCGGYKVEKVKEYFMDFYIYQSDITVDLQRNTVQIHKHRTEDWRVTVLDTGLDTLTGRRVAQTENYIGGEDFIVTFGDCLSDIDVAAFVRHHKQEGKLATMAAAHPAGRNELLQIDAQGRLLGKGGSGAGSGAWTDAGMYVMGSGVFSYIKKDCSLEQYMTQSLAADNQLCVFRHEGFWMPVETYRDRVAIEKLWREKRAPWYQKTVQ